MHAPVVVEHKRDGAAVQGDALDGLVLLRQHRALRRAPAAPVVAAHRAPHVVGRAAAEERHKLLLPRRAVRHPGYSRLHEAHALRRHDDALAPGAAAVGAAQHLAPLRPRVVEAARRVVHWQQPRRVVRRQQWRVLEERAGLLKQHLRPTKAGGRGGVLDRHLHVGSSLIMAGLRGEHEADLMRRAVPQPHRILQRLVPTAGGQHWARPARRVPSERGVRDVHMLPLHAAEPGAEQGPVPGVGVIPIVR
mmetsp:Transcript_40817/g.105554  ORF Transcript_40817/g.105554 Transcript_40817/m.105554 type:complete len:249 (+) Transcript_40817:554-1300(+)